MNQRGQYGVHAWTGASISEKLPTPATTYAIGGLVLGVASIAALLYMRKMDKEMEMDKRRHEADKARRERSE